MPNFVRHVTGGAAVTTVMRVIGLTPPSTISSSTDDTAQQFWTLATETGRQLLSEHAWEVLGKDFTIVTDGVTTSFPLPDDFNGFFADSSWNRTTRLPMLGSLSEVEWSMLKARNLGSTTFAVLYRVENGAVELYTPGTTGQTLVIPYSSRGWCRSAGGTLQDNLIQDDDVVLYDEQLFKVALKRAWGISKGLDTTAVTQEYNNMLSAAKSKDTPGRTISLVGRGSYPLLGVLNIPDTGYGS